MLYFYLFSSRGQCTNLPLKRVFPTKGLGLSSKIRSTLTLPLERKKKGREQYREKFDYFRLLKSRIWNHRNLKNMYWSWNSSTLATSCEEFTHWKRPWCWEGLGAGGEGEDRGWDDWMASLTQWTWVWVNSRSWWWTGHPGMLQFMGSQRVRHDWVTELNWTEKIIF